MFEVGKDSGDAPGEFQLWKERRHLDVRLAFPQSWHDLSYNPQSQILGMVTGMCSIKSATATLALGLDPAQRSKLADWETMVATNVSALLRLTHALLPGMVERNVGHVVNIGSTAGAYPYPGGHVYGASKAFVRQFSLNLKADLVGTGVRVTDIEPGLVGGTEFSTVRFGGDQDKAASVYQGTQPLSAEDIAEAVAWVIGLPAHVNINRMEMMPTCQGPGPMVIKRSK